jgi:hypothetical protein
MSPVVSLRQPTAIAIAIAIAMVAALSDRGRTGHASRATNPSGAAPPPR